MQLHRYILTKKRAQTSTSVEPWGLSRVPWRLKRPTAPDHNKSRGCRDKLCHMIIPQWLRPACTMRYRLSAIPGSYLSVHYKKETSAGPRNQILIKKGLSIDSRSQPVSRDRYRAFASHVDVTTVPLELGTQRLKLISGTSFRSLHYSQHCPPPPPPPTNKSLLSSLYDCT